jgi:hypothetical protein
VARRPATASPRFSVFRQLVAQQNYRISGFELAYANVRYGGTVAAPDAPQAGAIALTEVHWRLWAYDATVFRLRRTAFLRAWINSLGHVGRALVRDGGCRLGRDPSMPEGPKIGPLVADDAPPSGAKAMPRKDG